MLTSEQLNKRVAVKAYKWECETSYGLFRASLGSTNGDGEVASIIQVPEQGPGKYYIVLGDKRARIPFDTLYKAVIFLEAELEIQPLLIMKLSDFRREV